MFLVFNKFYQVQYSKVKVLYVYKSKYKKVGVLPIRIEKSNISSIGPLSKGLKH